MLILVGLEPQGVRYSGSRCSIAVRCFSCQQPRIALKPCLTELCHDPLDVMAKGIEPRRTMLLSTASSSRTPAPALPLRSPQPRCRSSSSTAWAWRFTRSRHDGRKRRGRELVRNLRCLQAYVTGSRLIRQRTEGSGAASAAGLPGVEHRDGASVVPPNPCACAMASAVHHRTSHRCPNPSTYLTIHHH